MRTTDSIQIIIVARLEMVRDSLKIFLLAYNDMEVVAEAGEGDQVLSLCVQLQPDVVLLDMPLSGIEGLTTIKVLRDVCPSTKVLVLTGFPVDSLAQQTLRAGAAGYLFKDATPEELVTMIRAAYHS